MEVQEGVDYGIEEPEVVGRGDLCAHTSRQEVDPDYRFAFNVTIVFVKIDAFKERKSDNSYTASREPKVHLSSGCGGLNSAADFVHDVGAVHALLYPRPA